MKRILVAMTAGVLALAEILGMETGPHTHNEIDIGPLSDDLMNKAKGGQASGGEDLGIENLRFVLTLRPIIGGSKIQLQSKIDSSDSSRERVLYAEKVGNPETRIRSRFESFALLPSMWMKEEKVRMIGREADLEKLRIDLAEQLSLPVKQIDVVINALESGHEITIGNDAAVEPPVTVAPETSKPLQGPPQFSHPLWLEPAATVDDQKSKPLEVPGQVLPAVWLDRQASMFSRVAEPIKSFQYFSYAELSNFGMKYVLIDED